MAKILGNPMGEIRGRIGGMVFSRNRGGQYVKAHVKQTNPSTQAQKNTRNIFRSVGGAWSVLTSTLQQSWKEFAETTFNPFKHTNKGQYSGAQAFRSLKGTSMSVASKILPFGITTDLHTSAITHTACAPNFSDTPPVTTVRPNIFDGLTPAWPLKVKSGSLSAAGLVSVTLSYDGIQSPFLSQGQLKDENQVKFALTAFLSNGRSKQFESIKSAFQYNLGNSGILTFTTPDLVGSKEITASWDASGLIANFKAFPWAGMSALLTVGVYGENCTFSQLGSIWVTLT